MSTATLRGKPQQGQARTPSTKTNSESDIRNTRPTSDVFPFWYKNNKLSSPCLPRADYSYRRWVKRKNITYEKSLTEQKLRRKNNTRPYIRNTRPVSDVYPVSKIIIKIKSSLRPMSTESDNFEDTDRKYNFFVNTRQLTSPCLSRTDYMVIINGSSARDCNNQKQT